MPKSDFSGKFSDVAILAGLSERELDRLLGQSEFAEGHNNKVATEIDEVERGQMTFSSALPRIRELICGNEVVAALLGKSHRERNEIIIAIGSALTGISPVPLVLAAKTLHYGYEQLCSKPI